MVITKKTSRRRFIAATASTGLIGLGGVGCGRRAADTDVIVLGAGLAGLGTAHTLIDRGAKVLVLEARARAGGRIQTLDDLPGRPEAGGSQIGSNYHRFVAMAERLGIGLEKPPKPPRRDLPEYFIALGEDRILPSDWPSHPRNPFTDASANMMPWSLPFWTMARDNPLPDVGSWRDPAFAKYDISVADHLNWSDEQLRFGFGINPGYGASADQQSALMWFQIMKALSQPMGELLSVPGGNARVPEAAANALGDQIRFSTLIQRIDQDSSGVDVYDDSGRRYRGKSVVITLPTASLANIAIHPKLPDAHQAGIRQLRYNRVVRAYFLPKRRFWEEDGLPASIWSDSYAGRVFALRAPGGDDITCFQSFITGPAAAHLDQLPQREAMALIQAEIERIRPATRGALKPGAFVSWGADPLSGGAYACWAPGQIAAFANTLPQSVGRVHFAGEHTARYARGIEGALESAERACAGIADTV